MYHFKIKGEYNRLRLYVRKILLTEGCLVFRNFAKTHSINIIKLQFELTIKSLSYRSRVKPYRKWPDHER